MAASVLGAHRTQPHAMMRKMLREKGCEVGSDASIEDMTRFDKTKNGGIRTSIHLAKSARHCCSECSLALYRGSPVWHTVRLTSMGAIAFSPIVNPVHWMPHPDDPADIQFWYV